MSWIDKVNDFLKLSRKPYEKIYGGVPKPIQKYQKEVQYRKQRPFFNAQNTPSQWIQKVKQDTQQRGAFQGLQDLANPLLMSPYIYPIAEPLVGKARVARYKYMQKAKELKKLPLYQKVIPQLGGFQKALPGEPFIEKIKKDPSSAALQALMMLHAPTAVKGSMTPEMARNILGIKKGATATQVTSAYKKLLGKEFPKRLVNLANRRQVNAANLIFEATEVLYPGAVPQPKLIGEGKISLAEKTRIAQRKIAEAQAGVLAKYKPKEVLPGGVLRGLPLGTQIPTPLEEAIKAKVKPAPPEQIDLLTSMRSGTGKFERGELYTQIGRKEAHKIIVEGVDEAGNITGDYVSKGFLSPAKFKPEELTPLKVSDKAISFVLKQFGIAKMPPVPTRPIPSKEIVLPKAVSYMERAGIPKTPIPTPEEIATVEERTLAKARGEVKKAKIEVALSKGKDLQTILNRMRPTKEAEWSLPDSIGGKKVRWDEVASDLGYTSIESIEPKPGQVVNREFYGMLVELKGGQPTAQKGMARVKPTKITKQRYLKSLFDRLPPKFYTVVKEYLDLPEKGIIPSYKRKTPWEIPIGVEAKPTKETLGKITGREMKARLKTQQKAFEEWTKSYRAETVTSAQNMKRVGKSIKQSTDDAMREQLEGMAEKTFLIDFRTPELVFKKLGVHEKVYMPLRKGQEALTKKIVSEVKLMNDWYKRAGKTQAQRNKIGTVLDGEQLPGIKLQLPQKLN